MKLRMMPATLDLRGKRVCVRVDWNVPVADAYDGEAALKLERTFVTIQNLVDRGAVVIVMTHLGRPKKRDAAFSVKRLAPIVARMSRLSIRVIDDALDTARGLESAQAVVREARPGSVYLLENVRFYRGEETSAAPLARAYASLGDYFINDAFASCHRAHASVVGIAKHLPAYAGPSLAAEIDALSHLLKRPARPFVAIIGGAKLSTKIGVLKSLLAKADRVLVGGAMAHPFFVAKKMPIGKSLLDKAGVATAKTLLKNPKLVLPSDVVVSSAKGNARVVPVTEIRAADMIGDIGTETMRAWSSIIKTAKTIAWNGPLGKAEESRFSHGSLVIARTIATRSKGPSFGVVGGGDTLPIIAKTGAGKWIDHISTGGGAMLEFIAKDGSLPGCKPLLETGRTAHAISAKKAKTIKKKRI